MTENAMKLAMVAVVVLIALLTGRIALQAASARQDLPALGFAEAFAAGIFLGAGLIHMLGDAQAAFDQAGVAFSGLLIGRCYEPFTPGDRRVGAFHRC